VTGSRTDGAAATAAAGAWPASIADPPIKAPPAIEPMLSIATATIHMRYLVIRFMVFCPLDKRIFESTEKSDGIGSSW
jgi:hypothetical protein